MFVLSLVIHAIARLLGGLRIDDRSRIYGGGPPTQAGSEVIHVWKSRERWPVSWERDPDSDQRSTMEPRGR